MLKIIAILVGLGTGIVATMLNIRKKKSLPNVSDEIFLEKFNAAYPGISSEDVLRERKFVSRHLGVHCEKLDPAYSFDKLSKHLNMLGSFNLAIGDLEDSVSGLFERLEIRRPYKSPSTIGELLYEIIQAKREASREREVETKPK